MKMIKYIIIALIILLTATAVYLLLNNSNNEQDTVDTNPHAQESEIVSALEYDTEEVDQILPNGSTITIFKIAYPKKEEYTSQQNSPESLQISGNNFTLEIFTQIDSSGGIHTEIPEVTELPNLFNKTIFRIASDDDLTTKIEYFYTDFYEIIDQSNPDNCKNYDKLGGAACSREGITIGNDILHLTCSVKDKEFISECDNLFKALVIDTEGTYPNKYFPELEFDYDKEYWSLTENYSDNSSFSSEYKNSSLTVELTNKDGDELRFNAVAQGGFGEGPPACALKKDPVQVSKEKHIGRYLSDHDQNTYKYSDDNYFPGESTFTEYLEEYTKSETPSPDYNLCGFIDDVDFHLKTIFPWPDGRNGTLPAIMSINATYKSGDKEIFLEEADEVVKSFSQNYELSGKWGPE